MISNPKPSSQKEAYRAFVKDDCTHRKVFCGRYEQCLDDVAKLGWDGFTCKECLVDERISTTQNGMDKHGLFNLLEDVIGKKAQEEYTREIAEERAKNAAKQAKQLKSCQE